MIGKPKYKLDDPVRITIDGKEMKGKVYIVDRFGTFFDSNDVSYDIMVEHSPHFGGQPCLYKHISEKYVQEGIDEAA